MGLLYETRRGAFASIDSKSRSLALHDILRCERTMLDGYGGKALCIEYQCFTMVRYVCVSLAYPSGG